MNTYTFDFEFKFMGCHGSFPVTVKYNYSEIGQVVDIMDMYIKGQANNILFTRLSLYSDNDQWQALEQAIRDYETADLNKTITDIATMRME